MQFLKFGTGVIMNKIKAARKAKNIKQWQLALEVGVHLQYISQIERGIKEPSLALLTKIAKVLGVNRGELI